MKKAKRGRVLVPIIENNLYSSIIFSISSGNNYPKKISEDLQKDVGNISKQLKFLERKNYVKSNLVGDKNVFPFEIRIYSINWRKIIDEFNNFYFPKEQKEGHSPNLNVYHEDDRWFKIIMSVKRKIDLEKKNEFLEEFFGKIFESVNKNKTDKNQQVYTIKEIFEALPIIFMITVNSLKEKEKEEIESMIKENTKFKKAFATIYIPYITYYKISLSESIMDGFNSFFPDKEEQNNSSKKKI